MKRNLLVGVATAAIVVTVMLFWVLRGSDAVQLRVVAYGLMPTWDLETIIKKSDAVILGKVTRELSSKPYSYRNDDVIIVLTDYEITVETFLYPPDANPKAIAVTVFGGASEYKGRSQIPHLKRRHSPVRPVDKVLRATPEMRTGSPTRCNGTTPGSSLLRRSSKIGGGFRQIGGVPFEG